jgi:hypothetical protein
MTHSPRDGFRRAAFVPVPAANRADAPPHAGGWLEAAVEADTRLMTPEGPRPAGSLAPGDRLLTLGAGALPLRWIGRRAVTAAEAAACPALAGIALPAHALGPGSPRRPLRLSPRAGVLVHLPDGPPAGLLAAAADLGLPRETPADAVWVQFLLPCHALVAAEGLLLETLHPARLGERPSDAGLRAAVAAAMPALDHGSALYGPEVRRRARARP